MNKPLTHIPPAQAEALYDVALQNAPRGRAPVSALPDPPFSGWSAGEWDEDDLPPPQPAPPSAHDWPSSSKSSR